MEYPDYSWLKDWPLDRLCAQIPVSTQSIKTGRGQSFDVEVLTLAEHMLEELKAAIEGPSNNAASEDRSV